MIKGSVTLFVWIKLLRSLTWFGEHFSAWIIKVTWLDQGIYQSIMMQQRPKQINNILRCELWLGGLCYGDLEPVWKKFITFLHGGYVAYLCFDILWCLKTYINSWHWYVDQHQDGKRTSIFAFGYLDNTLNPFWYFYSPIRIPNNVS